MAHDRTVAGVRCMQVLELLSDYVDGELAAEKAGQIEAHLRGCDWCEHFGRQFSAVVRDLRQNLAAAEPLDPSVVNRLRKRLKDE